MPASSIRAIRSDPIFNAARLCARFSALPLAANAASTAAVVLGEDAVEWLSAGGLPACLVERGGDVVRVNGWPAP